MAYPRARVGPLKCDEHQQDTPLFQFFKNTTFDNSSETSSTLKVELQRCHAALYEALFIPADGEITVRRAMVDGPDMRYAELLYEWKTASGWTVKVGFDNVVVLHKPERPKL